MQGKRLLIDISGVLHKVARRGARQVAMSGTSADAEEYAVIYLDSISVGGGLALKVVPCSSRSLKVLKVCPGTLLRLRVSKQLKVLKAPTCWSGSKS